MQLCLLLGMRQHHSSHVVLIFGFHTTTPPPRQGSACVLSKASCNCGFLMWVLIYWCLDQTVALVFPFKDSYGQYTAALKMYWNGLHLHLQLRWTAVSSTGVSSFKVINNTTPCPFIRTKNLVAKLTPTGCFLMHGGKKKATKKKKSLL